MTAFIWMETAYLMFQFGLYGLIIGVIHREEIQTDGRSNPGDEGGDAQNQPDG